MIPILLSERLSRIEECKMNYTEHYHDWLRDAHAMENRQNRCLNLWPAVLKIILDIKARIEQHISETKHQIGHVEEVLTVRHFPFGVERLHE
ncbi:ferritin-like domain-containing protein [Salmonella enterica subsp. enterica]|nr:ferritin-like domain-containing protein [Salmonella enterica subsp. enterica]